MSEKSSKTVRSKIPRFQGTRKKTLLAKTESVNSMKTMVSNTKSVNSMKTMVSNTKSVNPKAVALDQRAKELEKPDCLRKQNISKVFDADKSDKSIDVGDVPFEVDHESLSSILTNKGIAPNAALRGSEIPLGSSVYQHIPGSRLSMRESLNNFKEQLKLYRRFQQYENSRTAEANPVVQSGILNDKSTAVTPRTTRFLSEYCQPKRTLTMTESLEEHKKNIRIFREKMQSYDDGSRKAEANPEVQSGILNDKNTAVTPRTTKFLSEYCQPKRTLTMTESLEEHKKNIRIFREKMQSYDDGTLLTPKTPGSQVFDEFTPRQRQMANKMRIFSSATSRNKKGTEFKENTSPSGRLRHPTAFSTSKKASVRLYAREENSSLFQTASNAKLFSAKAVKRPLLPSLIESEENDKTINTDGSEQILKESCHNVGSKESAIASSERNNLALSAVNNQGTLPGLQTTVFSSPIFMSTDVLKSSNFATTPVTTSSPLCHSKASQYSRTCQQALSTPIQSQHMFLTDVSTKDSMNLKTPTTSKLVFESDLIKSSNTCPNVAENAKCTNGYVNFSEAYINKSAASFQPLPADLNDCFKKLDLSSRPRLLVTSQTGSCTFQNPLAAVPQVHQQKTTPTSQAQRTQRTPTTPFLSRPPMRVLKASSGLKCKDDRSIYSPNCLPMRIAATSVKRLRWADIQNQCNDIKD